jgi:hypothetical protein
MNSAGAITIREVLSSTGADFEHDPTGLADDFTPQGIEHPPNLPLPHHPVVQSGKTWIGYAVGFK